MFKKLAKLLDGVIKGTSELNDETLSVFAKNIDLLSSEEKKKINEKYGSFLELQLVALSSIKTELNDEHVEKTSSTNESTQDPHYSSTAPKTAPDVLSDLDILLKQLRTVPEDRIVRVRIPKSVSENPTDLIQFYEFVKSNRKLYVYN